VHSSLAAYGRFGKGVNPDSRLNLCDCAAYALATSLNAPLLFKGADFRATDVQASA
jgi:ribonuclease VapC